MTTEAPQFNKTLLEFDALFEAYATSAPFKTKSTRSAYLADLRKLLDFAKKTGVTKIDKSVIQDHLESLQGTTAVRAYSALQYFFLWATAEGKIHPDKNPMEDVGGVKDESKDYDNITVLSREKVKELLREASHNPRDLAMITIALNTGAKVSQIQALTKANIVKNTDGNIGIIVRKDNSPRKTALTAQSSKVISEYVHSLPPDATFLFHSRHRIDEPLTRAGIARIMHEYGKAIGHRNLSLSTLRYTFAVNSEPKNYNQLAKTLGIRPPNAHKLFQAMREAGHIQTPQIPDP